MTLFVLDMTSSHVFKASWLYSLTVALILGPGCAYPLSEADNLRYVGPARYTMKKALDDDLMGKIMGAIPASAIDHASDPSEQKDDSGEEVLKQLKSANADFAVTCRRSANNKTWAWEGRRGERERSVPLRCAWFERQSVSEWGGTLAHELAHHAGYFHAGNRSGGNECTVPNIMADAVSYVATLRDSGSATLPAGVCPALEKAVAAAQ